MIYLHNGAGSILENNSQRWLKPSKMGRINFIGSQCKKHVKRSGGSRRGEVVENDGKEDKEGTGLKGGG